MVRTAKGKCADCGADTENLIEVLLKPLRSKNGKVHRWKGDLCEECLQKRFDGMITIRG